MINLTHEQECIINAVVISVILNVVLANLFDMFATKEERKPPNGASELSLKGQFMHMMVHHKQVMITSSFIVALVVGLSVYLVYLLNPVKKLKKLKKLKIF